MSDPNAPVTAESLAEFCLPRQQVYKKHAAEFQRLFRTNLKQFWDNLTGLDSLGFDDWLKAAEAYNEDELSVLDVVEQRFGAEAKALILSILDDLKACHRG